MVINYIETPSGKKLFSFHRHDFKLEEGVGIDGGFDYTRIIGNPELRTDNLSNVIESVREQFVWGRNYDKENNRLDKTEYILLKNLDTDHIVAILKYFTEKLKIENGLVTTPISKEWIAIHLILIEELLYRLKAK
jgi:hypothetical protein